MQSRRGFLKILLGFGAILLPWSIIPGRWADMMNALGHSTVDLKLPAVAEPQPKKMTTAATPESLKLTALDDIQALTAPEMQGRKAGSVGEAKAAAYIAEQLGALGLKPLGDRQAGFLQAFTIPPVIETKVNGRLTFRAGAESGLRFPSANLLGSLPGEKENEVVVISAHYDHLGIYEGNVYPGANDNASGVGCILDVLRRILREGNPPQRTLVLAFWSAEEMGFVGSHAFVKDPTFPLNNIKAVLNADTVGNGTPGDFALWGDAGSLAVKAVQQAAAACGSSAPVTPTGGHNSDSVSFLAAGIPAVTLMTGAWLNQNHTPEDTPAMINTAQLSLASEIMYRAVKTLAF